MQNNEIKANDEFILHSSDGKDYKIVIYNVEHRYRPPEATIAFLLYDEDGKTIRHGNDDLWFIEEGFFILNKQKGLINKD